jgi:hypothetical protein
MGVLTAFFLLSGCVKENHMTVVINEDGSAKLTQDVLLERAIVENRMKQMAEHDDFDEDWDEDDEDEAPAKKAKKKEDVPEKAKKSDKEKDDELIETIRKKVEEENPFNNSDDVSVKAEKIELKADTVRIVVAIAFKEMKDLLANARFLNEQGFSGMLLDKNDKGHFRLTLQPHLSGRRKTQIQDVKRHLAAMKLKGSMKFIMPGKVVSSTLPVTKENETEFTFDAGKAEDLEAWSKTVSQPVVVTSESGKLNLDVLPLDSKTLARSPFTRGEDAGADLPLVEAGPGYRAVGQAITAVNVRFFPEAEKISAKEARILQPKRGSCTVRGKLHAPKDRLILSLNNAKLIKAVDDKNREVKGLEENDAEDEFRHTRYYGGGDGSQKSADFTLILSAPQPDAQALEEVQAEAEVVSFAKWKEFTVKELKADEKNELDLAAVLPGAKLVVEKVNFGKKKADDDDDDAQLSGSVSIKVLGPKEISQLKFDLKIPGNEEIHSYASRSSAAPKKRSLTLNFQLYNREAVGTVPTLLVRYPDDLKREKVKFTLEALDL